MQCIEALRCFFQHSHRTNVAKAPLLVCPLQCIADHLNKQR